MKAALSALKTAAEADPNGVSLSPVGASEPSLARIEDAHGLPLHPSHKALLAFSDGATVYDVHFAHTKLLQSRGAVVELVERDLFIIGSTDGHHLLLDPDDGSIHAHSECSPDIRKVCASLEEFILALIRLQGFSDLLPRE